MMGKVHSRAFVRIKDMGVRVKAVSSLSQEESSICASITGARVADVESILNDPEIHVVDVCTPTNSHRDLVLKAAQKGKHVFCEKPIARTLEAAEEMVKVCDKHGVLLGVNHVVRFFPAYERIESLVKSGSIGAPVMARLYRGGSFPAHGWNNWFADYSGSGGVLLDLMIHDFDFLRTLLGRVRSVTARSTMVESGVKADHALTILEFECGAICHVEGSWAEPQGSPVNFKTSVEIVGRSGMITYDSEEDASFQMQVSTASGIKYVKTTPSFIDPYEKHLRAFIKAVQQDGKVPVDGREGLESLKLSLAALKSAREGSAVNPEEVG